MKLTEHDIAQIEAYHDGTLSAQDEALLRERIASDQGFRQAIQDWERLWVSGVQATKTEEAQLTEEKAKLQQLEATLPPLKKERNKTRRMVLVLGVFAGLLGLYWWWTAELDNREVEESVEEIVEEEQDRPLFQAFDATYFEHLTRDDANLGGNEEEALAAYDANSYAEAWPLLIEQVEAGADSIYLLYAGVAALADQQAEQSVTLLEPLLDRPSFRYYQEEVRWYLALAYLEQGEKDAADRLLNVLEVEGAYVEKAKQLRVTLK
ncbi:MAG: hypothetical protein AAFO03_21630 [Bacteroidota bacterium]